MIGLSRSTRRHLMERQHLGMAHGDEYVSPLSVRELPKAGLVHRFACARFGNRPFALRSDTERCLFLEQYFRAGVIDIRVHVPSATSQTTQIAMRKGLRHPGGPTEPDVLITDFVVTVQAEGAVTEEAIQTRHAETPATDAFETECTLLETYWVQCGATFCVSRRDGLTGPLARNLLWLFPVSEQILRTGVTGEQRHAQSVFLHELVDRDHFTVREACRAATRRGALPAGASVLAFRQLLAVGTLTVDLSMPDLFALSPAAFAATSWEGLV